MSGREPTFLLPQNQSAGEEGLDCLRVNLERIREAAERVARSEGLEIADVEWQVGKQRLLRVFIDRVPTPAIIDGVAGGEIAAPLEEKGVSHADCQRVSQQLSVIIDVEELVPGPAYVLEISSPGLDRKLTKAAEFQRFAGRLAKITTAEPVDGANFIEGRLAGFADGKVRVELQGREARIVEVPLETIRKAQLVVEF